MWGRLRSGLRTIVQSDVAALIRRLARPESARQRVEKGIKDGTYKAPGLPEWYDKKLLHREEASKAVVGYIEGVRSRANQAKDGKFPLLGCSGMKGIGKTALLVHGARVLVPGLAQDPTVRAVYLTFNGGGSRQEEFVKSLSRSGCEKKFADAFGHMLMAACGVQRDVAQLLGFDDCLWVCCSLLHLGGDAGTVVFFVDEVGDLKNECTPTVSALMAKMGEMPGKLAFVFSHIQQDVLNAQQSGTGREVMPLPLPALPISFWKRLHGWAEAAATHPGLHQLLLACCGHPRALVDGLPAALEAVPNLLTAPTEAALITARGAIIIECKFNRDVTDVTQVSIGDIARRWFDFVEPMDTNDLARDGLLITLAGEGCAPDMQLLYPLVVQHWDQQQCETFAMAFHLQQAYAADAVVAPHAEKKMDAIMYHYEAVLRLAVKGKPFTLRGFYQTSHMDPKWGALTVRAKVPPGMSLVVSVPDFSNIDNVLEFLHRGFIVVSEAHSEVGIEYLSPYVHDKSGELIVAAVQCKFVNTSTDWGEIKAKVMKAVEGLTTKKVRLFPVICTTADQTSMHKKTYADGADFTETDLFALTQKMGILRLHVTKLGRKLESKYPWLRGGAAQDAPSSDCNGVESEDAEASAN